MTGAYNGGAYYPVGGLARRAGQPVYAADPARPWLALKTSALVAILQERLFV